MAFKITNKGLYWGLIVTFGLLYILVAFVSTLHAIDFFKLANITSLAVLLGIAYEVGQATVLFSILMTKNKEKFLPWLLMFLLTALQITANVYASFKHMSLSGNQDWTYWYTSILKIFGVQGGSAETYQVIISWISGALLPIVALGMTALVAQNIKLITEEDGENVEDGEEEPLAEGEPSEEHTDIAGDNKGALATEEIEKIRKLMDTDPIKNGSISENIKKVISPGLPLEDDAGDSPREQISKILEGSSILEDPVVEKPILDLSQFKSPGVYVRDGDPRERGEELPPEKSEFENFVDNVLPVDEAFSVYDEEGTPVSDIKHIEMPTPAEGDVEPELSEEEVKEETPPLIEPPTVVDVDPTPAVKYESPESVEELNPSEREPEPPLDDNPVTETEEDRQERLRNIAREKLKKK